jgi:hypothetical protein
MGIAGASTTFLPMLELTEQSLFDIPAASAHDFFGF